MSKQSQPAPTASTVGPCPSLSKLVARRYHTTTKRREIESRVVE